MIEQLSFQIADSGLNPTSPHQLFVREIKVQTACKLNSEWHSRLPELDWSNVTRNSLYICYGAFFNSSCIGVAIWSIPVAANRMTDGSSILELRRLALSSRCPKNTASWMLGVMVRLIRKLFPQVKKLISYHDTEVHSGTIYRAAGWTKVSEVQFQSWSATRERNPDQSTAMKVKWEKSLT